jgi:hypothetical protein
MRQLLLQRSVAKITLCSRVGSIYRPDEPVYWAPSQQYHGFEDDLCREPKIRWERASICASKLAVVRNRSVAGQFRCTGQEPSQQPKSCIGTRLLRAAAPGDDADHAL